MCSVYFIWALSLHNGLSLHKELPQQNLKQFIAHIFKSCCYCYIHYTNKQDVNLLPEQACKLHILFSSLVVIFSSKQEFKHVILLCASVLKNLLMQLEHRLSV